MIDQTDLLLAHAESGEPLPAGELWFRAPLHLAAGQTLRGAGRDRTILRPFPNDGGALLVVGTVWTALRGGIEQLTLRGSGALDSLNEFGLVVRGNGLRFRDVVVTQCRTGVRLESSVDNSFTDCMLHYNVCNVHAVGDGTGTLSVTTTRFRDCPIRDAIWSGCYIEQGWGLVFDGCIIESNGSAGIEIQARPLVNPAGTLSVDPISLRDTWLENNTAGAIVAWNPDRSAPIAASPAFVADSRSRVF